MLERLVERVRQRQPLTQPPLGRLVGKVEVQPEKRVRASRRLRGQQRVGLLVVDGPARRSGLEGVAAEQAGPVGAETSFSG